MTIPNVKTPADTKNAFEVKYRVTAKVNFKENDQIWYRDSQLFDGAQVNEFSTEISQWDGEGAEPDNFIVWKGDKEVEIGVTGAGLYMNSTPSSVALKYSNTCPPANELKQNITLC